MHIVNVFLYICQSVYTSSSLYISLHLFHDSTFYICSGILLWRWFLIHGKGKKTFVGFLCNLSFYILGGYITFPNNSVKEIVFFALFSLSAAHFSQPVMSVLFSGVELPYLDYLSQFKIVFEKCLFVHF